MRKRGLLYLLTAALWMGITLYPSQALAASNHLTLTAEEASAETAETDNSNPNSPADPTADHDSTSVNDDTIDRKMEQGPSEDEFSEEEAGGDGETDVDYLEHKAEQTTDSPASYRPYTLTVTKSNFTADTFQGVKALYRPGGNDGASSTYSCAAYVKRFYSQVHKVSVYNLNRGCTPLTTSGQKFQKVSTPMEGDIVRFPGHWAIVKKVNPSSKTVVLIEQNWKWSQGGSTLCKINRSVKWSSAAFFRLK